MEERRLNSGRPIRLGPWRGSDEIANLATYADHPLRRDEVEDAMAELGRRGYRRIITAALLPGEATAFLDAGFTPLHDLVLLRKSLDDRLPRPETRFRRWRRRNYDAILGVDVAAFEDFWQFDEVALKDALAATPYRQLRVTREPIQGYALSGVSGSRGYLQRLAVHPGAQGQGLGSALLIDGLRWMRTRGAASALVNTQHTNERAIALYLSHGFEREPHDLTIFERFL